MLQLLKVFGKGCTPNVADLVPPAGKTLFEKRVLHSPKLLVVKRFVLNSKMLGITPLFFQGFWPLEE